MVLCRCRTSLAVWPACSGGMGLELLGSDDLSVSADPASVPSLEAQHERAASPASANHRSNFSYPIGWFIDPHSADHYLSGPLLQGARLRPTWGTRSVSPRIRSLEFGKDAGCRPPTQLLCRPTTYQGLNPGLSVPQCPCLRFRQLIATRRLSFKELIVGLF